MTQEQLLSAQAEAKNPEALNYLHKQLERTKKINLIDQHLRIDPNLEDGLVNFLYLFYENKEQNQAVLQRFLIETPERKNQLLLMALNARNYELFGYLHQDPNFYGEIGSRLITEKKMTNRYWEMIINKVPLDWNILHDIINKQHLPLMSEIVENFLLKTLIHLKDNNLTEEYSSLFAVQDKQMIFVFIRGDSEPRKSASIQWFLERELSAKPNIDWECIHLLVKEHINGIGLSKVSTTKGILEILNTAQTTLKDGEQLKPYTAFYKSLTDFMTSLTQYRKLTPLALVKYNIVEFLTDKKTIPFNPPANYQALLRLSESLFNQAEALERSHPEINMSFLRPIIEAKLSDCEEATKKTPAPEKKFFSSASSKRAPVEGAVGEIEPVKEPRKTS